MNISIRVPRALVALVAATVFVIGGVAVASAVGNDTPNPPQPGAPDVSTKALKAAVAGGQTESYTGIKPCRLLDTRTTSPLADGARSFKASGNLSGQGGLNNCGIPTNATSIAINLTAISTGSTGFVRGWAAGSSPATATLLNFGTEINVSNQVNIPLCRGTSCPSAFTLRAYGSTDIVGDAVGYYTAPMYAMLTGTGTVYNNIQSGLVSSSRLSTGRFKLTFDRPISGCSVQVSGVTWATNVQYSPDATPGAAPANSVIIEGRNTSNAVADEYTYTTVTC